MRQHLAGLSQSARCAAAECAGRVCFCPCNASDILVLDPASGEVSFVPTGRPEGGNKWMGAAECAGRVYFCPFIASDILVARETLEDRCRELGVPTGGQA